jgi:hypothetical protein
VGQERSPHHEQVVAQTLEEYRIVEEVLVVFDAHENAGAHEIGPEQAQYDIEGYREKAEHGEYQEGRTYKDQDISLGRKEFVQVV